MGFSGGATSMRQGHLRHARVRTSTAEPPVGSFGDVVAALRVIAHRHACEDVARSEVREGLRVVTRMARIQGLSAAQVIVAAKTAWAALPEVRQRSDVTGQRIRLEQLVSLCVDAYYGQ